MLLGIGGKLKELFEATDTKPNKDMPAYTENETSTHKYSVYIPTPNKSDIKECSKRVATELISNAKVAPKILQQRLLPYMME